ncbi:hypothetical protein [Chroococcidiopsis sp. CCMEE 29]|jgi:hypothetical protein|uniref:hypothetical protein n=1 Tax=Chroococcidiopsis sp. CCMEE 29 TaxID=155894 RepID=UPI0020210E34|nr:hypothetical protein [Chroococcidiopsis sp. CCMEE 29]
MGEYRDEATPRTQYGQVYYFSIQRIAIETVGEAGEAGGEPLRLPVSSPLGDSAT